MLTQLRPNTWGPIYLDPPSPPAGAPVKAVEAKAPAPKAPTTQATAAVVVD